MGIDDAENVLSEGHHSPSLSIGTLKCPTLGAWRQPVAAVGVFTGADDHGLVFTHDFGAQTVWVAVTLVF